MPNEKTLAIFVVDLVHSYGSEKYAVQLANALALEGQKVDLIFQEGGNGLIEEVRDGVRKIEIGTRSPVKTVAFLKNYFQTTPPAALFGIMEKPSLLALAAATLSGYRRVVPTMHFDIDAYANLEHGFRRKVLRLLVALFYRRAQAVVAVSSGAGQALARWLGKKTKIEVILNGFDLQELRAKAQAPLEDPYFQKKAEPLILGCGRLVPAKGFDTLIKAFALLHKKRPAHLGILGAGDAMEKEKLEKLIASLSLETSVTLKGYEANPAACFAHADLFAHAARTEGFGNVFIEAMAAGTPVVTTDAPSGPREIIQYGKYGKLVPVDAVEDLAKAMDEALASPSPSSKRAEIQTYLDRTFSLSAMAKAYIKLTESLRG